MSELKRCPICNAEVKLMFLNCETFEDSVWDESIGNVHTWFKCYGCDSEFFHDEPIDIPEKQIEWWNTRKPMERIVERLEGIEESLFLARDSIGNEIYKDVEAHQKAQRLLNQELSFTKAIEIVKEEGGMNNEKV